MLSAFLFRWLQVRLTTPVNEDVMAEMGWNGMMDSDEVYATAGYMDPNNFSSHVCVKVCATGKGFSQPRTHFFIPVIDPIVDKNGAD